MPIVEAHILEGYAPQEKSRLTRALTDAVRFVVPAPDEAITVMLHEYPKEAYARGGEHRDPAPARPDPVALVTRYRAAMETRDLNTAEACLGEGFEMVFPASHSMKSLPELIDWAKGRYRFVKKTTEGIEAFQAGGSSIVFVRGTLAGEWPDGRPFSSIRFIDRFEVVDDRIRRQDVWNDLGEVRSA